jgi:hypothetical protein
MGQGGAAVFTATEIPIAIGVLLILSLLYLLKNNRAGLIATYAIMIAAASWSAPRRCCSTRASSGRAPG